VIAALISLLAVTLIASAAVTGALYQRERSARAQAEEHLNVARQAVSKMYTKVADQWLIEQPEVQDLRREFLEDALRFYERIAAQRPHDERSRHDLSVALHRMGNISLNLERWPQAFEYYGQCLEIVDKLRRDFPDNAAYQYDAFMNRLLISGQHAASDRAKQIALLTEADSILRRLVARKPNNPVYRDALAALCIDLAASYSTSENAEKARQLWREGVALASELVSEFPDRPLYGKHVATANYYLAQQCLQEGDREQANAYFLEAKQAIEVTRRRAPEARWIDEHACFVFGNCGQVLADAGDFVQAIPLLEDCRDCATRLIAWYPKTLGYRAQRAMMCGRLAEAYAQCDRGADRLVALQDGESDAEKVLAIAPGNVIAARALRLIRQSKDETTKGP